MYNNQVNFVWDSEKDNANIQKHGVCFSEASSVFYDPLAKIASDPDHSSNEDRYILIGQSNQRRLLFVVHVYREAGNKIRIISARRATRKEIRDFEEIK